MTDITREMLDAACEAYWPNHWPLFSESGKNSSRDLMTAALSAALASRPNLPFPRKDIERGLILFRTSNNAHGYTNVSILSEKVGKLPQVAKTELANMMRNIAAELDATPTLLTAQPPSAAAVAWRWRTEIFREWNLCEVRPGTVEEMERETGLNMAGLEVEPLFSSPTAAQGFIERLKAALAEARACLDGQPEYHHSGMGCGLEDRGICNRYEAMQHGWDCAIDRVYSEHVNAAVEVIDTALKTGGED